MQANEPRKEVCAGKKKQQQQKEAEKKAKRSRHETHKKLKWNYEKSSQARKMDVLMLLVDWPDTL